MYWNVQKFWSQFWEVRAIQLRPIMLIINHEKGLFEKMWINFWLQMNLKEILKELKF